MVTPVILCAILCNLWRVVIKLDPERFKSLQTSRDMQPFFFWNVGEQLNITTWCADNYNKPTTSRYSITNCLAFRSHFPSTCTIKSWSAIAAGCRGSFLQNKFASQIKTLQVHAESWGSVFKKLTHLLTNCLEMQALVRRQHLLSFIVL